MSFIFKWANSLDLKEAANIVKTSFTQSQLVNSFKLWVEECLEKGTGSYFGYHQGTTPKEMLEASRRGLLYPFYLEWCKKHNIIPETHKRFFQSLVINCPYPIKKTRRKEGVYFEGVNLKNEIRNRDYVHGVLTLIQNPLK